MANLTTKRAGALGLVLMLSLVGLLGIVGGVVMPDPTGVTVVVLDESGTGDQLIDMKGYIGEDFFFNVGAQPFIDANNASEVNNNLTAVLTVNTTTVFTQQMLYLDLTGLGGDATWSWIWDATEVGIFDWWINISDDNDASNFIIKTGKVEVLPVVAYNTAFDDTPSLDEDVTYTWDFSTAFEPAGFNYQITWPAGWTAVDLGNYKFNITSPADMNGYVLVEMNASDDYVMYATHTFNFTVAAVNDVPVISGIEGLTPGLINYTINETAWEWRTAYNLTFDEDTTYSFKVNAADVDSTALTYEFEPEAGALYTVAKDTYIINTTTNETAEIPTNFTITPNENANGEFWAKMLVSDGVALEPSWIWLHIVITPVNDVPVISSVSADPLEAKQGENITFTVVATDVDGDTLTYSWKDGTTEINTSAVGVCSFTTVAWHNITITVSDGNGGTASSYVLVNITTANTAPTILTVTAYPVDFDILDALDFVAKGEVEEGTDVELTCTATDAETPSANLVYTWKNNVDTTWTATGATYVVKANTLKVGESYTFTCTVSDGSLTDSGNSNTIKIVEKEKPSPPWCLIIIVVIILIVIIAVVLFLILKPKKKEEAPAEAPPAEGEAPAEGEVPAEGEAPAEGAPVEGEVPPAEGEVPPPETPVEGEQPPAPEAPSQEMPPEPQPPQ